MRADGACIPSIIGRVALTREALTRLRHAMPGLLDMRTAARDSDIDLTETCRSEGRDT
ncbi:hypothetical protein [Roseovarius sp.]|uniref:hypothetical protein n=1 Tax=Roseovarius sp. TaxID=1486281 RepID=UPI003569D28E